MRFFIFLFFTVSVTAQITQYRYGINSGFLYSGLMGGEQSGFITDLAVLERGNISLEASSGLMGFQFNTPGLQLQSVTEDDFEFAEGQQLPHIYKPMNFAKSYTERKVTRFATAVGWNDLWQKSNTKGDVLFGVYYEQHFVEDNYRAVSTRSRQVGGALEVIWADLYVGVQGSTELQELRMGKTLMGDAMVALKLHHYTSSDMVDVQLQVQKEFLDAIAMRMMVGRAYQDKRLYAVLFAIETSLHLRAWRPGVDPHWIKDIIDPFNGTALSKILYDFEITAGLLADWRRSAKDFRIRLTRYF
jgi:hypothetical protein